MFDWQSFFDHYGIEYVEGGRAGRGELGIACPWCVNPAHLDHLGVGPRGYFCWKGGHAHSGRSPQRLIVALIGCSYERASEIVGTQTSTFATTDSTFAEDSLRRLGMSVPEIRARSSELRPLDEFVPVRDSGVSRRFALPYLLDRGYGTAAALRLADRYGLMFAPSGAFAYRIIVPVTVGAALVTWTGRSVARTEALRYKSLSADPEKAKDQSLPAAVRNIKETLLDYDDLLRGGKWLVLTEGPFDAMRVGSLGEDLGIRATCLFGKAPSPAQIDLIAGLASRYDDVVALFDRDAALDSFVTFPDHLGVRQMRLPSGVKDPAELTPPKFARLFGVAPHLK